MHIPHLRSLRLVALSASTTLGASLPLGAQSPQKFGVQLAVLSTSIGFGGSAVSASGFGLEPQLRFNRLWESETAGVISLGLGGQWTTHTSGPDKLTIAGLFFEPRWIPNTSSSRFVPYVSGRFGYLQQSNNFGGSSTGAGFGGGVGLAIRLNEVTNIDAGVALVRQAFGDFTYHDGSIGSFRSFTTYAAKIGVSRGFPSTKRSASP